MKEENNGREDEQLDSGIIGVQELDVPCTTAF